MTRYFAACIYFVVPVYVNKGWHTALLFVFSSKLGDNHYIGSKWRFLISYGVIGTGVFCMYIFYHSRCC